MNQEVISKTKARLPKTSLASVERIFGKKRQQDKMEFQFKTVHQLSQEEIASFYELSSLAGYRYPAGSLEREHLIHEPDILIAFYENTIAGFYGFNLYQLKTPFSKSPIPVIYAALGFVHPNFMHLGLALRCLSKMYSKYLGRYWFIKTRLTITRTMNPKAIRALANTHTYILPDRDRSPGKEILDFINDFNTRHRKSNVVVNKELVIKNASDGAFRMDLTEKWDKYFSTRDSRYDELVLGRMVSRENGRYESNGDAYLVVAYYDFRDWMREKIKRLF